MDFSKISAVILDADGVLWRGDDVLPAMPELFKWLNEINIPYVLATNNSSKTPSDHVAKVTRLGGVLSESQLVSSATATASYLQDYYPAGTRIHVLGMKGVTCALEGAGYDLESDKAIEVVVCGIDFEMTYENLKQAALHIQAGAVFIGTNPDLSFPSAEGFLPGAGSILAALEAATGVKPRIVGKPYAPMFESALKVLNTPPEKALMIGDRLETDISGAQQVGMKTALVFTGVTSPDMLSSADNSIWPDVAYEGLPELLQAWAGHEWYRKVKRHQS